MALLRKVLIHFNFGANFLQWFKTLHTDISSCVLNNGHASHFFPINRGVRQGCPLSGLLFVIGLELFARAIKCDDLIKGIRIGEKEIKTTMYADDTTVFVSDPNSIGHLLDMPEKFASTSGLRQKPKLCGWVVGKIDKTPHLILIGHKNLFAR